MSLSGCLSLIQMLPLDIASYITMHAMDLPAYATYESLKRFVMKYVRTLKTLHRGSQRPAHLLEEAPSQSGASEHGGSAEYDHEEDELLSRLDATDDPGEKIEILAVMKTRGFRAPTRGLGGPRQPPTTAPATGGPTARYMPPRGRQDVSCINCGRKGHQSGECRQPRRETSERPCFNCGKTGHEAKACTEKKSPAPVKAIENAQTTGSRKVSVFCVQAAPPRRQQPDLGDFIAAVKPKNKKNSNRYQP